MSAPQVKIAVLISGSGSNLQAFIDACSSGKLAAKICLVISNKADAGGLKRARDAGIETCIVDHRNYATREEFDQALLDALQPSAPDLIILAGFMRILTPVFIGAYQGQLLNIHPSLLPTYPGLNTHQRAIDAGDQWAGATVHFVTQELDGGPPILHARVAITDADNAATLAGKVQVQEHLIYPLAAQWFAQGILQLDADGARLQGKLLPPAGMAFDGHDQLA